MAAQHQLLQVRDVTRRILMFVTDGDVRERQNADRAHEEICKHIFASFHSQFGLIV